MPSADLSSASSLSTLLFHDAHASGGVGAMKWKIQYMVQLIGLLMQCCHVCFKSSFVADSIPNLRRNDNSMQCVSRTVFSWAGSHLNFRGDVLIFCLSCVLVVVDVGGCGGC